MITTIKALAEGNIQERPQSTVNSQQSIAHAPKIFTETCSIHWNRTVDEIHNLIRGLSPFPGAFTSLHGKTLKIYKSKKEIAEPKHAIGEAVSDGKHYLKFACYNGYIHLLELQLEGKKKMNVEDFLRGNKV